MAKIFYSEKFNQALSKPYIFVDNDALSIFYSDAVLLEDLREKFQLVQLWVHPFTEFEFLRGVSKAFVIKRTLLADCVLLSAAHNSSLPASLARIIS